MDDKTYFIQDALEDEEVEIQKLYEKGNITYAKIAKVLKKSKNRVEPFCQLYNECGGCDLQHIDIYTQREYKEKIVIENFSRIAKIDLKLNEKIAFSKDKEYRIRARFSKDANNYGFYKKQSKDVVNINNCPILSKKINECIPLLKQNESTNVICSKNDISYDKTLIDIKVLNKIFKVNSKVFFQSNIDVLEILIKDLLKMTKGKIALDLYSGVGLFSAFLEDIFEKVYSVEINKECILLAKENLKKSIFISNDAAKIRINDKIDFMVVDPPRIGLDKKVINLINKFNPERLIYVSCDSATAARDIKALSNYNIIYARVYDFYPHSKHIETMIVLNRE